MAWQVADNFVQGMSVTFSFFIPGPPLSVDKLRDALNVAIREKIPQAGARQVVRNGVCRQSVTMRTVPGLTGSDTAGSRVSHPQDLFRYDGAFWFPNCVT